MAKGGENRPRKRAYEPQSAKKVPMSKYYRSGGEASTKSSPFKSAASKSSRRRWLVKAVDLIVGGVFLFCLVYSLIVKPQARLVINDTSYHPTSVYKLAVQKELSALKNKTKLTLDEKAVVSSLQSKYPEIASASLELPLFGQTPTMRLQIAQPTLVITSLGVTYIVDSEGRAVAKSTDLPSVKNLQTVDDQSGFSVTVGKQVLRRTEVDFINSLISQTKRSKIPVASLTLPTLAAELDLRTADRPYFVKFFLGGDPLQQTGQYLAARHQFDQSGSQPNEYLDVRVAGKIFYK